MPASCYSQDKLWFSNKIEVGYGKVFVSEQISFKSGIFIKNTVGLGLKFKISKKATYQTLYLLENSEKNHWRPRHHLGARFRLKF